MPTPDGPATAVGRPPDDRFTNNAAYTEKRRLPRWSELRPLLGGASYYGGPQPGRVANASTIWELRSIARRRVPRAVFDYVDGAAERELSLQRARERFDAVEFRPRVLRDVSQVETSTALLGQPASFPVVCAPTGFSRMMHWTGETAVALSAAAAGVPYTLSYLGTTSLEEVAAAAPGGTNWFQLYVGRDRNRVEAMVKRAATAGYTALMVTVDTPVAGARLRDVRSGLTIPPCLSVRTVLDMARSPGWWLNVLTRRPLRLAALEPDGWDGADVMGQLLDPSFDVRYLTRLRKLWDGPLVVKGVQTVDDARTVIEIGADAVVLSNHGGRQLDRARTPLDLLPEVVSELGGTAQIYLDGGVLSGADIAAALALGADAVLIGRAYLYGLMAGGQAGVTRAIEILSTELMRTLQLLGVRTVHELAPDHVHLPGSRDPRRPAQVCHDTTPR